MKLIIAEKPSQAQALAGPFSKVKKQKGFYEIPPQDPFPDGAYLTWCVGHLLELVPPKEYKPEWEKWKLDTLPMMPERFRYKVSPSKWDQFQIIKKLAFDPKVTGIIGATDAGREGELIYKSLLMNMNCKKPVMRLWISSLTKKAVLEGFRHLKSGQETLPVFFEAYSRACADWLVGLNTTRAYTLLMQKKGIRETFPTGRVMTPTVALVVKREAEIENFKPEPFFEVIGEFDVNGNQYSGKWQEKENIRLKTKEEAEVIAERTKDQRCAVADVRKDRKEYHPPMLYNLSALQAKANQIYKYSPEKTLNITSELYLKKIVSYPRSDSPYITEEEAKTLPGILQKLAQQESYNHLLPAPKRSLMGNPRFVNAAKVSDHYAIIPTENVASPEKLSRDERNIYDLIVRSVIAAHYDKAVMDTTTIVTKVNNHDEFVSKGKVIIQEGWRKVLFEKNTKKADNKDDEENTVLPDVQSGETGTVEQVSIREGKTQAPKRYTLGSLVTLMKTAGKTIEDEELSKVLNQVQGLGTEATRSSIIKKIEELDYIRVQKNQVYATEKAKALITAIGEDSILTSAETTALWEQRLHEIGKGRADAKQFIDMTKRMTEKVIQDAIAASGSWKVEPLPVSKTAKAENERLGTCPFCGKDIIHIAIKRNDFYGCSGYKEGCKFTISGRIAKKKLSPAQVKRLLEKGETTKLKGFKSKQGKPFAAALALNKETGKIEFKM
ncbi:type IA DNA topoisomerase [Fictibacillus sp. S7]|uniref:type IA DNA topoisomerase n=1 Tax=Fictibacillus sp. S7 TaxID=2212476 RepID=UPI001012C24A|nr:type IA DNA topoisomerase [Fictibacillus sp. S7]RXY99706.1 DNA topoisomerase III [Fictibacillus sp. S7]